MQIWPKTFLHNNIVANGYILVRKKSVNSENWSKKTAL